MDTDDPLWASAQIRDAVARDDAGTVFRLARRVADLNQTELGQQCGYSASTISRIERGQPPAHDINVRRRLATALRIPPEYVGLSAGTREPTRATFGVAGPLLPGSGAMVERTSTGEKGEPVHRREVIAALAATAAGSWPQPTHSRPATSAAHLEALLTADRAPAKPVSVDRLSAELDTANISYAHCRYDDLTERLPALIATAVASRAAATGQRRDHLTALLSATYQLSSELCIKLNDDAIAWVLADRALNTARDSGSITTLAASSRSVAIAMRRAGHYDGAVALLIDTAQQLGADTGQPNHPVLATYGSLLCTAAYSSAQAGNRPRAEELIGEATAAANRFDPISAPSRPPTIFNPTNVAVYKIGVYTALGDSGTALRHARTVDPTQVLTPERYARYCIDTARAWERHGDTGHAYHALKPAERHAPQELRRPSIRDLVATLLYAPTPTPTGLRDLAIRIGAAT